MADGRWQMADGKGQRADGRWQMAKGKGQMADGKGQMADGKGQMAKGRWQRADGKGQMAKGEWQMADGRWQRANGGANGEWRVDLTFLASAGQTRDITREAFWPPKPKLLEIALCRGISLAVLGT